jgi:lipopolysaccharide/colanic/teichoic acid biosynthesis glycosyltransferase
VANFTDKSFMNNSEFSIQNSRSDSSVTADAYVLGSCWTGEIEGSAKVDHEASFAIPLTTGDAKAEVVEDAGTAQRSGVVPKVHDERRDFGWWLLWGAEARSPDWARIKITSHEYIDQADRASSVWFDMVKRGCDIAGSLFLLLVFLPLFAAIAMLIKLDTGGPILFRQSRVGKDGVNFVLWKFRSMSVDAARYETSPISAFDMRITRVGRFIRRLSFDELPQLINVLRGDMSLVGPRPEMPFVVREYGVLERERLCVKPGITGLWQISPARAFPIHENLQYDLHYIRHRNLFFDCAILVRTITAVVRGVGAV